MTSRGPRDPDKNVVNACAADPELEAARVRAQETLGEFIAALASPSSTQTFSVKVAFTTPKGTVEHMWLSRVAYSNQEFRGTLDNDPRDMPKMSRGDNVTVRPGDVEDWAILDVDPSTGRPRMRGGYSMAILVARKKANRAV
jgi:uncharacterized protein YegJ (DUF2314 family)